MPKTLYPHQQKGFEWGLDKTCLPLFWQMRLGKTPLTIRWIMNRIATLRLGKKTKGARVLIVVPKTIIQNWINELNDEGIKPTVLDTKLIRLMNGVLGLLPGWFITNYESITFTNISEFEWDVVCLDESHRIKDPNSKITHIMLGSDPDEVEKKAKGETPLKPILHLAPVKAILTGSPAPENAIEYFNQLKFLFGDVLGMKSFYQFRNKFFFPDPYKQGKFKLSKYMGEAFRDYVSRIALVLKRDQLNIGSKKIYETRYVEWDNADNEKEYKLYEMTWFSKNFESQWVLVALNHMRQMTGGFPEHAPGFRSNHKIKEVVSLLNDELKDEPVVIWCYHVSEIKQLKETLIAKGFTVTDIQGSVPNEERQVRVDDFNNGRYQIIILQYKVGSLGLNLSRADTVIRYSKTYSATEETQSEDRVIHPEKERPILYIDILTKDTIDEEIYALVKGKIEDSNNLLEDIYRRIQTRIGGK